MVSSSRFVSAHRSALPLVLEAGKEEPLFLHPGDVILKASPQDPTLCFSKRALQKTVQDFIAGFPGKVSYAVKANSHPYILKTLVECGVTIFDAASLSEIQTTLSVLPSAVVHYHNPVKSRFEIKEAYETFGCKRFAVDHMLELEKISELLPRRSDIEIAVRMGVSKHVSCVHDFSAKFGAPFEDCVFLLRAVVEKGFTPVLTFHPGSQCRDPDVYRQHIEEAALVIKTAEVDVKILNVGGGFPARYLADDKTPSDQAFFATIKEAVSEAFPKEKLPLLECEPGRSLVADCTSLLARVNLVKLEKREIYLNDGMYGALMEMYQNAALVPHYRAWRLDECLSEQSVGAFVVYGPTCDPLDKLPGTFELPLSIHEGDYVEFLTLGAYGDATTTHFNGYGSHKTVFVEKF